MRRSLLAIAALLSLAWALPSIGSAQEYGRRYGPRAAPPGEAPIVIHPDDLSGSAHQLSMSAFRLYRVVRTATGESQLTNDSLQLARAAEAFHQSVETPGRNERFVYEDFLRLSGQYHQVRERFFRAYRSLQLPQIVDDWTRMVNDYERLALTVGVEDQRSACNYVPHARWGRTYSFQIR
jgi:hypothetical protein